MSYSEYTLFEIEKKFGISSQRKKIFQNIKPINDISERLKYSINLLEELPVKSEKAKSELIIMPILLELREKNNKFFTIYSGDTLNINDDLKGECDFILSKETNSFEVNYPIIQIVEAKKNDLEIGIPQCAAQMIGARKYNEQRKQINNSIIFGCVTTGDDWIFLRLENSIEIDTRKYYLGNLPELLGAFQEMIDYFKNKQ